MRLRTILAVLVLSLALPASANAAAITYTGGNSGTVVYTADPGETLNTVIGYEAGCASGLDCVTFYGDAISSAPGQCAPEASGDESCFLDPDHGGVHVVAGAGNDSVSVFDVGLDGFPANTSYAIAVDGGDGNDHLLGGSSGETLNGGSGADIVTGMGGSDRIDGGDGNDVLGGDSDDQHDNVDEGGDDVIHGGAGDDQLTGDAASTNAVIGHDVLDGGAGTDTIKDDWYRYDGNANDEDPPPTVTFDGQANDGRPGENDDVVNVEKINTGGLPASSTPGTWVGSDGPDTFNLLFSNGDVHAGGGDDVVTGSDYVDTIDGGAGNDKLSGGFDDDTITGGPGQDTIDGDRTASCEWGPVYGSCTVGSGNDTIYTQDGEKDTIDCGPGADTAYVDAIDVVAECETVHVAGGAGGSGGGGGGTGGGGGNSGGDATTTRPTDPAKVARPGRQRLSVLLAHGLRVTVRCTRACRLAATLSAGRRTAKRLHLHVKRHHKAVALATKRARLRHAGTTHMRLRPSRATRKRLRHAHALELTLTVKVTDGAGHHWTVHRTVKVRR